MSNLENNEIGKNEVNEDQVSKKENIVDLQKEIISLKKLIEDFSSEMRFGTGAFAGSVSQAQDSVDRINKLMDNNSEVLKKLLISYTDNTKKIEKTVSTISLLPSKNQESLKKLVPEIGVEIGKIYIEHMEKITSKFNEIQESLEKNKQAHIDQFTEHCKGREKIIEDTINNTLKNQEKVFVKLVNHTKEEIESVTSNHGSKFIRNTAVCLILAAIAGAVSGWYIDRYFPRFVQFEDSGDITIHSSRVMLQGKRQVYIPKAKNMENNKQEKSKKQNAKNAKKEKNKN